MWARWLSDCLDAVDMKCFLVKSFRAFQEAKAKITTLQQTANQSEAAKVALEAQVETLQTRVADQEARLMDQDELQRALAEQQEAKDTLEKLERLSKQESEERLGF